MATDPAPAPAADAEEAPAAATTTTVAPAAAARPRAAAAPARRNETPIVLGALLTGLLALIFLGGMLIATVLYLSAPLPGTTPPPEQSASSAPAGAGH